MDELLPVFCQHGKQALLDGSSLDINQSGTITPEIGEIDLDTESDTSSEADGAEEENDKFQEFFLTSTRHEMQHKERCTELEREIEAIVRSTGKFKMTKEQLRALQKTDTLGTSEVTPAQLVTQHARQRHLEKDRQRQLTEERIKQMCDKLNQNIRQNWQLVRDWQKDQLEMETSNQTVDESEFMDGWEDFACKLKKMNEET